MSYFVLHFKRLVRIAPFIIAVLAVTLFAASAFCDDFSNSDEALRIKVGVVGDIENNPMGIGLIALENLDTSRFSVEFIECDGNTARECVERGEFACYIDIPDDFVESVLNGTNKSLTVVSAPHGANFSYSVMCEIAQCASSYITESQSGIYAVQRALDGTDNYGKIELDVNMRYISTVFSRGKMLTSEELGADGSIGYGGYYFAAVLLLFIMLLSVMCAPVLARDNNRCQQYLRVGGYGCVRQICCEYLSYCLFTVIIMFAAIFTLSRIEAVRALIPELVGSGFAYAVRLLPAVALVCAISLLIYELVRGVIGGVFAQLLYIIFSAFVCGYFYPYHFFPEGIQRFARILPAGSIFSYSRAAFAAVNAGHAILLVGLSAVAVAVTCAVRTAACEEGGK